MTTPLHIIRADQCGTCDTPHMTALPHLTSPSSATASWYCCELVSPRTHAADCCLWGGRGRATWQGTITCLAQGSTPRTTGLPHAACSNTAPSSLPPPTHLGAAALPTLPPPRVHT